MKRKRITKRIGRLFNEKEGGEEAIVSAVVSLFVTEEKKSDIAILFAIVWMFSMKVAKRRIVWWDLPLSRTAKLSRVEPIRPTAHRRPIDQRELI